MPKQTDLLGKTFDQQVAAMRGKLADKDIRPNRMILGEVILEPVSKGIRVTARNDSHRLLWGFIASKDMLQQMHCPVAVYDTLRTVVADELKKHSLSSLDDVDPLESAKRAMTQLQQKIQELSKSLEVKKVSDATRERARTIGSVVNDACRLIDLQIP